MYTKKFILILVFGLLLSACGGQVSTDLPPAQVLEATSASTIVDNESNSPGDMAENTANPEDKVTEDQFEGPEPIVEADLPLIPEVTIRGDEWFHPTPVNEVVLASGVVQVFDFSAIWCSYCRFMAPTMGGLAQLYGDQANFVMIDIDRDGANEYGPFIDALEYDPRFRPGIYILAPDGSILARWLGPVDGRLIQLELVAALQQYQ
jgi:thiol-disulfide isomerase/thioredoxin